MMDKNKDSANTTDTEKPLQAHLLELLTVLRKILIAILLSAFALSFIPVNLFSGASSYVPLVSEFPRFLIESVLPREITFSGKTYQVVLIYTNPFEGFSVTLYSALLIGLLVSSPYVAYQIYMYVKPALYPHEKRALKNVSIAALGLFLLGTFIAYKLITPIALKFLFALQAAVSPPTQLYVSTSIDKLFGFVVKLVVATGLAFEIPLLIYYLLALGVLSPDMFSGDRMRYAFILILIVGAMISPDPTGLGMLMIALPYYIVFYIAVKLGIKEYKKRYPETLSENEVSEAS